MDKPGMMQALVNALRAKAGMGAQQSPGPAMNLQNGYRQYAEDTMLRGEAALPFEEWMRQQQTQQTAATLR